MPRTVAGRGLAGGGSPIQGVDALTTAGTCVTLGGKGVPMVSTGTVQSKPVPGALSVQSQSSQQPSSAGACSDSAGAWQHDGTAAATCTGSLQQPLPATAPMVQQHSGMSTASSSAMLR